MSIDNVHSHPGIKKSFASPVPVGSGWPTDTADDTTPVAKNMKEIKNICSSINSIEKLSDAISICRGCKDLVRYRETIAVEKRKQWKNEPYWGRPAPGFGIGKPGLCIVGLAPAAHGANRTGRIFTGDRSGDWLFASLHRLGIASEHHSYHVSDGQRLTNARIIAAVRCAPPANKPTVEQRDRCAIWMMREFELMRPHLRSFLALGGFAWNACIALAKKYKYTMSGDKKFGHMATSQWSHSDEKIRDLMLVGSYHVSPHNTSTGRLTEKMLDAAIQKAASAAQRV